MMPTLAPNTTSKSREGHFPENIPSVLTRPNSQDRGACRVCEWGAFAALASTTASIRVVSALKAATACATSTATTTTTSIAATSTGYLQLCCHHQLDYNCLRATRSRKTVRNTPHVTLPDEISEGGVQAFWVMIREKPEFVTEVHGGDRGEGAWLR